MKLKCSGYDEKNMVFHLTPKTILLPVEPGGENVIGISVFNDHIKLRATKNSEVFLIVVNKIVDLKMNTATILIL